MGTRRRSLLATFLAAPLFQLGSSDATAQVPRNLPLTLSCPDDDDVTLEREAGPYFKPNSPLKRDLFRDAPGGERMTVAGYVLDRQCQPIPETLVEIWHADENGAYDGDGFRLRGHQLTDERGRWWFNTIVPALYPGRTRHFHFKAQRPGGSLLTTQLFFPGEARNARDYLYDESLLMKVSGTGESQFARFDFVM